MNSFDPQLDQPIPKPTELPFDSAAFCQILAPVLGENLTVKSVFRFGGGFSNLTYLVTLSDGRDWVVRTPPRGVQIQSAHDMHREFTMMRAVEPHFGSVPKAIFVGNADLLGIPFLVMSRSEGVILRANAKNIPPPVSAQISDLLIQKLIELHSFDPAEKGLLSLGKPDGYVKRQVEGWKKRYENSQTDAISDMDWLGDWLVANMPKTQNAPCLIHNDFKFDNVVFSKDLTKIEAVLDWEMSTIGDPLMDLGAMLAYWCEPDDPIFVKMHNFTWQTGFPKRQELAAKYAEKTGRDLTEFPFYLAFGFYKNAVIAQQIYKRWKDGKADDPRFGQLIEGVKTLGAMGKMTAQP